MMEEFLIPIRFRKIRELMPCYCSRMESFEIAFASGISWICNFHGNGLAEADLLLLHFILLTLFRLISSSEGT